jgi:hypothetical protein
VTVSAASTIVLVAIVFTTVAIWVWCKRAQDEAVRRAEALLEEHLTPAELAQLNQTGSLHVASRITDGRVYSIPVRGLVTVMEGGTSVMRLCIRPADILPGREAVLAHKIHIEAAEEDYMRRAIVVWRAAAYGTRVAA